MNPSLLPLGSCLAILAFSSAVCSADVLATYSFGGATLSFSPAAHDDSLVASSIWSANGYLDLQRSGATFGASGAGALGISRAAALLPTTAEAAISGNRWVAFQLTPEEGFAMTVDSVSFYANIDNAASAANTVTLQARTGDVANPYVTLGATTITTVGGATPGAQYTISFTALSEITEVIAFRLVFSNPGATGNWTSFTRLDDLTAHGTVAAIPEPAAMGATMAAAGLAFATGFRRRKRV